MVYEENKSIEQRFIKNKGEKITPKEVKRITSVETMIMEQKRKEKSSVVPETPGWSLATHDGLVFVYKATRTLL